MRADVRIRDLRRVDDAADHDPHPTQRHGVRAIAPHQGPERRPGTPLHDLHQAGDGAPALLRDAETRVIGLPGPSDGRIG
jgi:hypothetical protein